jgi:PAS domain S-box-containing protein
MDDQQDERLLFAPGPLYRALRARGAGENHVRSAGNGRTEGEVWVERSSGEEQESPDGAMVDDLERGGHIGRFKWWSDGDRVEWSDELYRIYGLPRDTELTLDVILEIVPETDPDWIRATAMKTGTRESPLVFWQRVARRDGEERVVEVRAWAEDHGVVMGTAQDVTQRVQARDERDRLHRQRELVLSATADGICGLDRDGRITFFNRAAAAILGRSDEVLLGASLHDLVHRVRGHEAHPSSDCPFVIGAGDGIARRDRHDYFRRPDDGAFEAEYTMLPVSDPELDGSVVSFRDITDRVNTERRLRRTLTEVQALSAQRARLLSEVTLAQEEERARIAGDIHDDTVQVMNAVALRLERAETRTGVDPAVAGQLGELRSLVREATHRLRRLLFDLYPPDLANGLPDAILRYGAALGAEAGFEMAIDATGTEGLTDDDRTLLYRLAQEALANVAKHAGATHVTVTLETGPRGTQLRVQDDGVGFEPQAMQASEPGHLGLTMLRQRTESAGGQLRLRSGPGRGTQVEAWLPSAATEGSGGG